MTATTETKTTETKTTETKTAATKLHWVLRIAVAAEFIGHGAFGIIGKQGWLAYYEVFGIQESLAWTLMPITGTIDIALGLLILLRPTRLPLAFMAFWGLFTAALRPVAGEGVWEFFERSYNFGVPLALLLLSGLGSSWSQWLARIRAVPRLDPARAVRFAWGFRAIIGAYLVGHGGLGVFTDKDLLITGYQSVGLTNLVTDPHTLNQVVGWFEIGLGVLVFAFPATWLLWFVLVWKVSTELLYVTMAADGAVFEVIERGGAYAAPLALILLKSIVDGPGAEHPKRRGRAVAAVAGVLAVVACTAEPPTDGDAARSDRTGPSGVVAQVLPSVVSIEAPHGGGVTGAGFRVAIPGIVVTAAHVVQDATEVAVVLHDGSRRTGTVLGRAPELDIAAVRVADDNLPPLHSGSGLADLRVGDHVLAVGPPSAGPATSATVTMLDRQVTLDDGAMLTAVQIDAAIGARLAGAPLIDTRGHVVGVLTTAAGPDAGFAVPVTDARDAVFRIVDG